MLREELRLATASIISYAAFQIVPLLLIVFSGHLPEIYAMMISLILAMLVSAIPSSILLKDSNISFLPPLIGGSISLLISMLLSRTQVVPPDLSSQCLRPEYMMYYVIVVGIASGLSITLSRIYPKPAVKGVEEVKVEEARAEEVVKREERPPKRVEEEIAKAEEAPKPELIKCPHCGKLIPSDSIFCPLCGEKIGGEE